MVRLMPSSAAAPQRVRDRFRAKARKFDDLPDAGPFARRMFDLCADGGCMVGSFPAWSLVKGPVRKVRYEWVGDCPIYNYERDGLELMLRDAGFGRVKVFAPGRSGYLVRAYRQ